MGGDMIEGQSHEPFSFLRRSICSSEAHSLELRCAARKNGRIHGNTQLCTMCAQECLLDIRLVGAAMIVCVSHLDVPCTSGTSWRAPSGAPSARSHKLRQAMMD